MVIALHPHNIGIRGQQEMMESGKSKTKPTKRGGNFLHNEYLSRGGFDRLSRGCKY